MGASDPEGIDGGPRPAAASVHTRPADGARLVVAVSGEVDLSNAGDVEAQVVEAMAGVGAVAIDLNGVTYLDSRGLQLLLRLAERHAHHSLDLVIVAAPRSIAYELLQVTGLVEVVPVVPGLG
ncbi:MAG: STAS domain-containing protein [Acidimicrobiales bacterium]